MKRALASMVVVLGVRCAVACSPFESSGSVGSQALDASSSAVADAQGSDAASQSPDASAFCTGSLACDLFDGSYGTEWKPVPGNLYQPSTPEVSGKLLCALNANALESATSGDACQLERPMPVNVKMRIEFELTFYAPNDYRNHNIQVFALFNGTGDTRTYLGLYVQNPRVDHASIVLTLAHATGGPMIVGTGSIDYGVPTHIAIDASFGTDSAVRLDSVGATDGTSLFSSFEDAPVTLLLGPARQNGGTDAFHAEYDNFRVLPIATF